jgi:hypothetical protein
MSKEEQESSRKEVGGLIFVGCLLLGLAIGFLIGNMAVGIFGGLGVGFIAMGIALVSGKKEPKTKGATGLFFVGCLILGLAIGFLLNNVAVGLFGGLGVGFILMAIARYSTGDW